MRPLGENQLECLRALKEHGGWPGGWYWDNNSGTKRILESLVKRGLATTTTNERLSIHGPNDRRRWIITEAGRKALEEANPRRAKRDQEEQQGAAGD